jgi:hypothetical protein
VLVEDAGDAIPDIAEWAGDQGLTLESAEPYSPPFDDVFVELIGRLNGGGRNDG